MRILKAKSAVTLAILGLIGVGAFWATSALAAKPQRAMLPATTGLTLDCPETGTGEEHWQYHEATFEGLGTFEEVAGGKSLPLTARLGQPYISENGLKTVPLQVVAIGGIGFAEGIGETRFWLDSTRPVPSAIWEKRAGTEFPAIQEMRFHFFYTLEARPGKVYRSVNPARMRSEYVRSFPPPPGTVYNLVEPVELEDVSEPGLVVGKILRNRVTIPEAPPRKPLDREFEDR